MRLSNDFPNRDLFREKTQSLWNGTLSIPFTLKKQEDFMMSSKAPKKQFLI